MALLQLFQLPSLLRSAMAVTLHRNIGISAVFFNRAKDLDPVQRLFLDKMSEYNNKSKALLDADASYQEKLSEEITKLQKRYGGGDLTKFPEFKFPEPNFEELTK